MLETISENPVWFLLLISTVLFVILTTIFSKEAKCLFFNKQILAILLSFFIVGLLSIPFSTFHVEVGNLEFYFTIFISFLFAGVLYGLLTKLILQAVRGEEASIIKSFTSIKKWFLPSLLAYCIGISGGFLIFYLFSNWERPQRMFLCIIWTALTFALYPLLIADEGNPFLAIPRAFKITVQTFHKWFYLFLTILFVSGEFLQLFPSSSVRVSWSGGYTFQPIWFDLMTKSADLSPTAITCIYIAVLFVSSVIATLVKIKLTKILFDSGYISNESSESSAKINGAP